MTGAEPLLPPMGGSPRQIWAPALVASRLRWLDARRASHGLTAYEEAEYDALDRRRIARLCRQLEAA